MDERFSRLGYVPDLINIWFDHQDHVLLICCYRMDLYPNHLFFIAKSNIMKILTTFPKVSNSILYHKDWILV
jgi:hypothetical protein